MQRCIAQRQCHRSCQNIHRGRPFLPFFGLALSPSASPVSFPFQQAREANEPFLRLNHSRSPIMSGHHRRKTWSSPKSLTKSFFSRFNLRSSSSKTNIRLEDNTIMAMEYQNPPESPRVLPRMTMTPRASPSPAMTPKIQTSITGPCTFSFEESKIVEGEQYRVERYPSGVNPFACHQDVCLLSQGPAEHSVTFASDRPSRAIPRIQVDHDHSHDLEDLNIGSAVIYSPSLGDFTSYSYGRRTPSPARSSYDSTREKDTASVSSGGEKETEKSITRSITGLFAKLGPKKKGRAKTPSTPNITPQEKENMLPVDVDDSPQAHIPQKPSPLRKVQSATSLSSFEKELLRGVM